MAKTKDQVPKIEQPQISVDKDRDLFHDINGMVKDARNATTVWADKHDKYYRLRIRRKKNKNFPFPGCSNLRLPTIETQIRKLKATLIGLYSNIKPRMQVVPQSDDDLEKANRVEKFLDWLADYKMYLLEKLVLVTDKMLEKGFCLAEVEWRMTDDTRMESISLDDLSMEEATWVFSLSTTDEMLGQALAKKFNIDMSETVAAENMEAIQDAVRQVREGKESITIQLKDELYNAPWVNIIDSAMFFVNSDSGTEVQTLRMAGYEFYEPYENIKMWARQGKVEQEAIDNIDFHATQNVMGDSLVEVTKDTREGISRLNNPSHLVKLYKVYTYYDLDKDDIEEKCVFLLAPDFKQVLKREAIPYDHKKFPFIRFATEIIDDRWFSSRGIPEHLEDISKEIDAQHNQKIDNQTIRNAPMFKFRSGIVNPSLVKFIPGQGIPVPGMTPLDDAIKLMDSTNAAVDFSYEREEMMLKTVIQEYLGVVDYSLQSMINKREPRTLGEVQMQAQAAGQTFSLAATMFTNSLSELFTQILELCQQYMPQRVYTLIAGADGIEPIHLSRDEIQGKYHILCRGNDINTNPNLKLQRAQANVQMLLSPVPIQSGVVQPVNIYNALKRFLQDGGEVAWKELISNPQPQPPPPPPPQLFGDMEDGEQMQVLQQMGIKPDLEGRALKKQMEVLDAQAKAQKTKASK